MTIGVGKSTAREQLSRLQSVRDHASPISIDEYLQRQQKLGEMMRELILI